MYQQLDLLQMPGGPAGAGVPVTETVSVGSVRREQPCLRLSGAGDSMTVSLPAAEGGTERILEVCELHRETDGAFAYEILLDGQRVAVRTMEPLSHTLMPYFLRLPGGDSAGKLTLRNLTDEPVHLAGVWLHSDPEAVREAYLTPMEVGLCFPRLTFRDREQDRALLSRIREDMGDLTHFTVGIGIQILFMQQSDDELEERFRYSLTLAREVGLRLIFNFNSWWDGTPGGRDGRGGYFSDVAYQQVVYDPLSGKRALSIPNMWGNTPWMTMNHPHLNEVRCMRLSVALELLKNVADDMRKKTGSVPAFRLFIDNEPTYWSEFAYSQSPECGGDFNECCLADARRDGVELEPSGRLRPEQRRWLIQNLSTYISQVSRTYRESLSGWGWGAEDGLFCGDRVLAENVFTHIFPHSGYPWADERHPHYEEHVTEDARLGIEAAGYQDERLLAYAAGTGRWAQVNAERCCYVNSGFHHGIYRHGAACDIIFNYFYDQDVAAFHELDDLDGLCAEETVYGRQVMRYCAYTGELSGGTEVSRDNLEVAPLRERWVLRPAQLGTGSITFCAGGTDAYPYGGWLEILGLIRPRNGAVSVEVGYAPEALSLLAVLPERDADYQRIPLRIDLGEWVKEPGRELYIRLNVESTYYDDWAQMNAVWDIRTVAAMTDRIPETPPLSLPLSRALFTLAALRQDCRRLIQQYPEAVDAAVETALAEGDYRGAYSRLVDSLARPGTAQPPVAEGLPDSFTATFLDYDRETEALRVVTHEATVSRYQEYLRLTCPADTPVSLCASRISGDMLDHISTNPYTPAAIVQARLDPSPTVASLRPGDRLTLTLEAGRVVRLEAERGLARGRVVDIEAYTVTPPMHNGYLTVETAPGERYVFELGMQTRLNYTKAPAPRALLCPEGDFGLARGCVVLVSFEPERVDERPYRALKITVV